MNVLAGLLRRGRSYSFASQTVVGDLSENLSEIFQLF